jgi:ets translocation variant 5
MPTTNNNITNIKSITKPTVSSWHSQYNERMFNDPLYTTLKLQSPMGQHQTTQQQQQQQQISVSASTSSPHHLHQQINPYPDSTSHHSLSTVPSVPLPDSTYHHHHHSNYIYRSSDISSSTEQDYPVTPLITSTHTHSLGISQTGQVHQRRGSLQLWQFLVALLDEPSVR